jgi:3-isopropylmalate/(R)-2-methylmalate dehydratase large subunit
MLSDPVRFDGRVLFLTEDPALILRQLDGADLAPSETGPLRDQISTDEITPAFICYHFDEKLGDFPYLGLKCGEAFPVKEGAVRKGGFSISVAGKRRGKGSSREASPYAEQCAGIRLVIAESFERIYRQNCQNLGLLTSTDFGLIPRIRRGEAIPLAEFTAGLDPITAEIVRRGGLFSYNAARLRGDAAPPQPSTRRGP